MTCMGYASPQPKIVPQRRRGGLVASRRRNGLLQHCEWDMSGCLLRSDIVAELRWVSRGARAQAIVISLDIGMLREGMEVMGVRPMSCWLMVPIASAALVWWCIVASLVCEGCIVCRMPHGWLLYHLPSALASPQRSVTATCTSYRPTF